MGWWTNSVAPPEDDWWFEAGEIRRPRTRDEIIREIQRHSRHRWWRINRDYRWLKKRMKKMGYSPDDAKDLLR